MDQRNNGSGRDDNQSSQNYYQPQESEAGQAMRFRRVSPDHNLNGSDLPLRNRREGKIIPMPERNRNSGNNPNPNRSRWIPRQQPEPQLEGYHQQEVTQQRRGNPQSQPQPQQPQYQHHSTRKNSPYRNTNRNHQPQNYGQSPQSQPQSPHQRHYPQPQSANYRPQLHSPHQPQQEQEEHQQEEAGANHSAVSGPPLWLQNVGRWGDVLVGGPVRWLFAGSPQDNQADQEADPLPGWLWMLVLFCGITGFFWDVILSQAAVTHIFTGLADPGKERVLASGLIINVKSSTAGGIVSLFSSVAQYLFLRKLRQTRKPGRLQFLILLASMVQNWVFNVVGYSDLFHHQDYLEWNPFATLWTSPAGVKPHIEWGSLVIMVFSIVTAAMPEFCWSELTRPRKPKGQWVQTRQGMKWVTSNHSGRKGRER
jgi:hypothetical protein